MYIGYTCMSQDVRTKLWIFNNWILHVTRNFIPVAKKKRVSYTNKRVDEGGFKAASFGDTSFED